MKTNFYLPIILLLFTSYNSCLLVKQDFEVENFQLLAPKTILDSASLHLSYDIKLKHYLKNASYQLHYEIYLNTKKVYQSENFTNIRITQSKNAWKPDYKNNLCKIPYSQIEIPAGNHKVELRIKAEGNRFSKGYIFKEQITINKPELYNYKDQNLLIKKYDVYCKDNNLNMYYKYDLAFKNYQTIGVTENEKLRFCYVIATFSDINTNKIVALVSDNFAKAKSSAEWTDGHYSEFEIPYEMLKLKPGQHQLNCKFNLADENYQPLKSFHDTTISIQLPQFYNVDLKIESLALVTKKKYDVSSVLGQIFSKEEKKKGLGYPDVFWKFKAGQETKYQSNTNNNSFSCPPEETGFLITDNQSLSLSVWDEDLEKHDLIGTLYITNKKGPFEKSFNKVVFGNVRSTLHFEKIKYEPWKE